MRWQEMENYRAVRVDYPDKAPASPAELRNRTRSHSSLPITDTDVWEMSRTQCDYRNGHWRRSSVKQLLGYIMRSCRWCHSVNTSTKLFKINLITEKCNLITSFPPPKNVKCCIWPLTSCYTEPIWISPLFVLTTMINRDSVTLYLWPLQGQT